MPAIAIAGGVLTGGHRTRSSVVRIGAMNAGLRTTPPVSDS